MDIAWVYQRDAEEVTVREDEQNKPDIKQFRMDVSFDGKAEAIAKILNETGFDRCMVFCNTKGNTERITKVPADAGHRRPVHPWGHSSEEAGAGDGSVPQG